MKIAIIGAGMVGATAAYALVMRGVGREIVLVDLNRQRAEAEADDILHAVPFAHPLEVRAGDYPDITGARLVIITAGVAQKPDETRLQLVKRNAAIFKNLVPRVLEHAPEAILLVTSNPVDIMTHLTTQYAAEYGVPASRIIGSGTTLDTARFRALLGRYLGVDPQHMHAYVLGEHGDSEVLTWSLVSVGGIPLEEFCKMRNLSFCTDEKDEIDRLVRRAAYHIIAGKGATYYGIGSSLARISEIIVRDQRSILTVSSRVQQVEAVADVTLSLPNLVCGDGIGDTLHPPLSPTERAALQHSAQVIADVIRSVEN